MTPGHDCVTPPFTARPPWVGAICPESELPTFMSDTHVVPEGTTLLSPEAMGTFDENGVYIPRSVTEDDLGGASLEDAMAGTIVEFEDGDLVEGTVVKIDRDEVLLDIGFKSEGVIPCLLYTSPSPRD